ncbi:MAG: hypothetical protein IJF37_04230 [Lachnospiraceae bacterium]|nr:hypothetical protein [Lachnospiraceae bacterium]
MYSISKNTVFLIKNKKVIALNDIHIANDEKGYFILNFWEQCDYKDIEVLPVAFAKCETLEELYVLKKDNIILGSERDICLI